MCAKKPHFKNTRWKAEYQLFVADAGYETHTETLVFTSDKAYRKESAWELPPYPAMYMNADGTVDTMPGHSSHFTEEGTYSYQKGKLTLKSDDGSEMVLDYHGNTLEGEIYGCIQVVFKRVTE